MNIRYPIYEGVYRILTKQPRKIWRDSLSARPARQTSEEEQRDKKGGYCRHREAS